MYKAPVEDMSFLIDDVLRAEETLGGLPRFEELGVGAELTGAPARRRCEARQWCARAAAPGGRHAAGAL